MGQPSDTDSPLSEYPRKPETTIEEIHKLIRESDGFEHFLKMLGKRSWGVRYRFVETMFGPSTRLTLYKKDSETGELTRQNRYEFRYKENKVQHCAKQEQGMAAQELQEFKK